MVAHPFSDRRFEVIEDWEGGERVYYIMNRCTDELFTVHGRILVFEVFDMADSFCAGMNNLVDRGMV